MESLETIRSVVMPRDESTVVHSLATALFRVRDANEKLGYIRMICDSGVQANVIREGRCTAGNEPGPGRRRVWYACAQVRKLWEIDSIDEPRPRSFEEQK